MKKLRYRSGIRVYLLDPPAGYAAAIRAADVARAARLHGTFDLVHAFFTRVGQVERAVPALVRHLGAGGIAWLSYPKARQLATDLDRDTLAKKARALGLRPVAIVSVDAVWSALRCRHP